MQWLYRNGTVRLCARGYCASLAVLSLSMMLAATGACAQQGDEPMDDQDAVSISCQDGTELQASFNEDGVEVTLSDGSHVSLPQNRTDEQGYSYSNGKFTLSGDDRGAQWAVGKKAPVACEVKDDRAPTPFDAPITIDTDPLPADKANPDAHPQVNCYRFQGFMIKEVDLGEKGAEKLAVSPQNAACKREAAKDEKVLKDDMAGYFLGAKGNFVFFQAADGWNGGMPFVVYDVNTMKRLFDDNFEGEDFNTVETQGETLTLTFRRAYTADCSLYLDGGNCATRIKQMTGLGGKTAKIPECGPAYDAEKKRTPDYAKEIEQLPSVISYEAMLKFDGKTAMVSPLEGGTSCRVPD